MKILITDGVGIKGVSYQRGDIAEVSDADARLLIHMGRARKAEDDEIVDPVKPEPDDEPVEPAKHHRKWRK